MMKHAAYTARCADDLDVMLGARVRHLRKMTKRSMKDIADELGISGQQLQKYEMGTSRMAAGLVVRLSSILKVSVAHIYDNLAGKEFDSDMSDNPKATAKDLLEKVSDERKLQSIILLLRSLQD